jgi:hypothetical protein
VRSAYRGRGRMGMGRINVIGVLIDQSRADIMTEEKTKSDRVFAQPGPAALDGHSALRRAVGVTQALSHIWTQSGRRWRAGPLTNMRSYGLCQCCLGANWPLPAAARILPPS